MSGKKWMKRIVLVLCLALAAGWQQTSAHAGTRVYVGFDVGGGYTPYNGYTSHDYHRPPPPRHGWWGPPPPPPRGWYQHHSPSYWHGECRPRHHRHHDRSHDRYDRW